MSKPNLTSKILNLAIKYNYRRQKDSGDIYKSIHSYSYIFHQTLSDFIQEHFTTDNLNVDDYHYIVDYIQFVPHADFPFVQYNSKYIGFINGVFNIDTCMFTTIDCNCNNILLDFNPPEITHLFVNHHFDNSINTPLIDAILDIYFDKDVKEFLYASIGRLFHKQSKDNLQYMLYFFGGGYGQDLLLNIISYCFNQTQNVSLIHYSNPTSFHKKLHYMIHNDIVICPESSKFDVCPFFFNRLLTQQYINYILPANDIEYNSKFNTPLLFAGIHIPPIFDTPLLTDKILRLHFDPHKNNIPQYKFDIIQNEIPAFIHKCLSYYKTLHNYIHINKINNIWSFCPQYFTDQLDNFYI